MIELAVQRRIELLVPDPALTELERVLARKLGFSQERVAQARALVSGLATEILPDPRTVQALSGDPDDDRILASALQGAAEVLVTGDRRHLLPLSEVGTMRIITPQALLAELG